MQNALIAALQKNYREDGPIPPDPSTVRGLLDYCCLWLDNEVTPEELNNPCFEMAGRLQSAGEEAVKDLEANEQLNPTLTGHLERTAEAYYVISDLLECLPELAENEQFEKFEEALDLFDAEREAVLNAQAAVEELLSEENRLCPGCGTIGIDEACPSCGLVHLYPDSSGEALLCDGEEALPAELSLCRDGVFGVLNGQICCLHLAEVLAETREYLGVLSQALERLVKNEYQSARRAEDRLGLHLQTANSGIDRMESVQENFRIRELKRGWNDLYGSIRSIQRLIGQDES